MTTGDEPDESDEPDDRTDRSRASFHDEEGDASGDTDPGDESEIDRRGVVAYLEWGAIAGLGLVALVAVFRFYFAASRAIGIWISPDFEPLFQAVFNLAVLMIAASGIAFFARRLR